jgi:signal transduction histidine kinase/CheY-like chemotaxis protein
MLCTFGSNIIKVGQLKVSSKLYSTFIILLFIILILGYAGFLVQRTLNTNFQKYAGKILPNAIEAIKMRAEMERVAEYSKLYEITGNGENRWKAWNAINGLQRDISSYTLSSKGHINDSTLKSINANVSLFIQYSSSFLKTDKSQNPDSYEELKNLMNIQQLRISYTLKVLIDKDVLSTKETERILGEKTKTSLLLIICAIGLALIVFILAVLGTYLSILKPIKSLTETAKIIGDGNVEGTIEDSILLKDDEIGILARSFRKMVNHLVEVFESRNELNTEVNEEIEKKSQMIEYNDKLLKLKAEPSHLEQFGLLTTYSDNLIQPINGILGFVELLNQTSLSPEKKEFFISQIRNNAMSLSQLIEDMSDLAKIEMGKFKIGKSSFPAIELISEMIKLAEIEKLKVHKNEIKITSKLDSSINELYTDKYRIKQIFKKLIDNAIQHTTKGQIEIGYKQLQKEKKILFHIKDTGHGVPSHIRHTIFNKQKSQPNNLDNNQIGFSLAVCKVILQEMDGEIWMESTEGEGTTVFFTIKLETKHVSDEPLTSSNIDWNDKTILVVDDEEINKVLINECLENTKAKLLFAKNGKEAVYLFSTTPKIDLILMDLKMPEMDGYKATEIIKIQNKDIPIIANTAYAMLYERDSCLEHGFDDYIAKPFSVSDLITVINKHLK